MEIKEFAEMLNGCGEITTENKQLAKDNDFIIVTGASDDIMSFDGAISDEGNCYHGGIVRFSKNGTVQDEEALEDAFEVLAENGFYIDSIKSNLNEIEAVWCPKEVLFENGTRYTGANWDFKTKIPHCRFEMHEYEEVYGAGIVFKLSDLK